MTRVEIASMIEEMATALGCDYDYYHYQSNEVVKAPYLLFDYPNRDDVTADNANYARKETLNIEYDSKFRNFAAERKIEEILTQHGFTYSVDEQQLDDQGVYEIIYSMQVFISEG